MRTKERNFILSNQQEGNSQGTTK